MTEARRSGKAMEAAVIHGLTRDGTSVSVARAQYRAWRDHRDQQVRDEEREWVTLRSAALFESAWDDGNALGLDGWTGPERGEEPDEHAIAHRERHVDKLVDELHARMVRDPG